MSKAARLSLAVLCLAPAACSEAPPPVSPPAPTAAPEILAQLSPTAMNSLAAAASPAGLAYPATRKRPVVDELHGTKITDDYRWLEKSDDPEVAQWTKDQARFARAALDAIPSAPAIRARLTKLRQSSTIDFVYLIRRGDVQFLWKIDPKLEQPILMTMPKMDDPSSAKVVLDPAQIDATGKTKMDFYVPSLDGKKVAVSLSKRGSEAGDVHVYETATGKALPDVIPHVNGGTAGGSLAWNRDGTGFYYTRYPKPGERAREDLDFYQQVYFHKLGTPEKDDVYAIGKEFPRIAEVSLGTSDDGKLVLATVANGDGGEFAHWLHDGKAWKQVTKHEDKVTVAAFGRDGNVYMLSRNGAPRGKILRLSPAKPDLAAADLLVPESQATIQFFTTTKSKLYVVDLLGGPSKIRLFDLKGKLLPEVPIPAVASVGQIARLGGDDVLIRLQTFLDAPAWYRFKGSGAVEKSKLFTTSPADFSAYEAVREVCKSKDGTEVPLNVLRRKGMAMDGKRPAFLTGYGGFNVSLQPYFDPTVLPWLEQGGIYAIANLRGGGELGEAWHEAGMLTKKQNVFDDFAACAKHLVAAGYTSHDKLATLGGSNGGLLMGALLTQHPELVRAVVSEVGIYDMVRMEAWPNGVFNTPEYGSVKDPAHFQAMFAYSPYHRVRDGRQYPSVLFTTGVNDPRVDPSQSRKMAARLQAAGSKNPVLLFTKMDAGHGSSSMSDAIDHMVDVYAFLFHELGVDYKPVE